jgi:uncharacterized protein YbaR (Trm112 family)
LTALRGGVYITAILWRPALPIDSRLLDILICPACRGAVVLLENDRGIECRACGRVYPIRQDIPVMLVDEATPPTDRPPRT